MSRDQSLTFGDLLALDIPESLVSAWAQRMNRTLDSPLLPLQGIAIGAIDELRQRHTLILGPTSSGKTFVGEVLAALIALSGEGTVIYAVPYRAMATQKWQEWHSAYALAGLDDFQVYVSSKDHVAYDAPISRGDFQIAIVVYEKLAALLAQGARILDRCSLLLVDEFQMLSHFDRGPRLEFVLTTVLNSNARRPGSETYILGLSATLSPQANTAVDDWLSESPYGSRPLWKVESADRPVALREHVLTPSGVCLSRNQDGELSRESIILPPPMPNLRFPNDLVCSLVAKLVKQDRKILVFRASRQQSSVTAEMLTGVLPRRTVDEDVAQRLDELERTPITERLATALVSRGIAFHNASLSFEERNLVEDLFSSPGMFLSVLCSTETLAMGINLPADTVIIADLRKPAGELGTVPFSVSDYKNMVGRAGRYGFLDSKSGIQVTGQSFIFARNELEAERLYKKYVSTDDPGQEVQSAVRPTDLQHQVLSILSAKKDAAIQGLELEAITEFLKLSLYARHRSDFEARVSGAWHFLVARRMIRKNDVSGYRASGIGRLLAQTGLSVESADFLAKIRDELSCWGENRFPLDLLFLVCLVPEVSRQQWPRLEKAEATWRPIQLIASLTADIPLRNGSLLSKVLNTSELPPPEILLAIKRSYLLLSWSRGMGVREIGRAFGKVHSGDLRSIADSASWVLDAILALVRGRKDLVQLAKWLRSFSGEIEFGVPESVVRLARARVEGLHRHQLAALAGFIDARSDNEPFEGVESALENPGCPLPERLRQLGIRKLQEVRNRRLDAVQASHERRAAELGETFPLSLAVTDVYQARDEGFEAAIAALLEGVNISVQRRGKGHAAPDLEIERGGKLILVEAKSSEGRIGTKEVRQIQMAETAGREVTNRIVIAKGGFTDGAIKANLALPESQWALLLPVECLVEMCLFALEEYPGEASALVVEVLQLEQGLLTQVDAHHAVRSAHERLSRSLDGRDSASF